MAEKFDFSFVPRAAVSKQDNPEMLSVPPADFVANIHKAIALRDHGPKDGPAIVAAVFKPGTARQMVNVERVTGLIIDIDSEFKRNGKMVVEPVDPDWVMSRLPYFGVAHTSYRHTPEVPKFRVIMPFAEPLTIEQHRRIWHFINEKLEKKIDPACKDACRLFYLPRAPIEAWDAGWPWAKDLTGTEFLSPSVVPVDFKAPEDLFVNEASPPARVVVNGTPTPVTPLIKIMRELPIYKWAFEHPNDVKRNVWRGLGMNIAIGMKDMMSPGDPEGEAFFQELSSGYSAYSQNATHKMWLEVVKSAQTFGPIRYSVLCQDGAPDDVCVAVVNNPQSGPSHAPVVDAIRLLSAQNKQARMSQISTTLPKGPYTGPKAPTPLPMPSQKPNSPGTPSGGGDDDDGASAWDFKGQEPTDYLVDQNGKHPRWFEKVGGIWTDTMSDAGFTHQLKHAGLTKKAVENFKNACRGFKKQAAVWDSTEDLVTRNNIVILNTYREPALPPASGKWDDIELVIRNLTTQNALAYEYVLDWLAVAYQSIRLGIPLTNGLRGPKGPFKLGTALVFISSEHGSGKGTLGAILEVLYGEAYAVSVTQQNIDGKFNAMMADKLLLIANEVTSNTNKNMETANKLKTWITDSTIICERKGIDAGTLPNTFNMIFTSNDEAPVIIEPGDRRYSVFKSTKLDPAVGARVHDDLTGSRDQVYSFAAFLLARKTNIGYGQRFGTDERTLMQTSAMPPAAQFVAALKADGLLTTARNWLSAARGDEVRELTVQTGNDVYVVADDLLKVYKDWCSLRGYKHPGKTVEREIFKAFPKIFHGRKRAGGRAQFMAWSTGKDGIPLDPPDDVSTTPPSPPPTVAQLTEAPPSSVLDLDEEIK